MDTFRGVYIGKMESPFHIGRPRLDNIGWDWFPSLNKTMWARFLLETLLRDLVKLPNSQETKWQSNEKVSGAQEKGVGGTGEGCVS